MAKQSEMLVIPTLEEVLDYAKRLGPPPLPALEAEAFYYYYESNGWMVGKVKMKCWRAAMAGWRVRWLQRQKMKLSEKVSQQSEMSLGRTLRDIEDGNL